MSGDRVVLVAALVVTFFSQRAHESAVDASAALWGALVLLRAR